MVEYHCGMCSMAPVLRIGCKSADDMKCMKRASFYWSSTARVCMHAVGSMCNEPQAENP
jgi:hypothetical protein